MPGYRLRDSDDETDDTSRNVRQRLSPIPGDPYMGEPIEDEESEPEEEPFEDEESEPEEEPFEEEEASPIAHPRLPSPLPPRSPPSPIAPPSPPAPPAPIAPPSPVLPSLRFTSRNQGTAIRWDWMPISLRAWRNAEQLPRIPIPLTLYTPTLPLTREPIHHTIPVMVARLRTHDEQLEDIERALETAPPGVEELQQQVYGIESELSELRDEVVDTHMRGRDARQEIAALRQEVAAMRQEMAEIRAERDQLRVGATSS